MGLGGNEQLFNCNDVTESELEILLEPATYFAMEIDSTLALQQLDYYRRELVDTGSVAWLIAA